MPSSASASATTSGRRSHSSKRQVPASWPAIPTHPPIPGGAFLPPILLRTDDPWGTDAVHDCEPFGPVSTIMPYKDMADAIALANRGRGSLALSLFTHSPEAARDFVQGAAAYYGRMLVIDRTNAAESTGHGSPLPVLVHGGPGRAGGSEEMGGVRGEALHAADRRPVVAHDDRRDHGAIYSGRPKHVIDVHPFRLKMSELHIGDTWKTPSRTVSIDDIEHFAEFTGTSSTPIHGTRKPPRHRRSSKVASPTAT